MDGEVILGIVTAIATAIVTIVTLLVRSNVIALRDESKSLRERVNAACDVIFKQNEQIRSISGQLSGVEIRKVEDKPYDPKSGDIPF